MLNWGVIGFGRMGKQYVDCLRKESNIFNLIGIDIFSILSYFLLAFKSLNANRVYSPSFRFVNLYSPNWSQ